MFIKYLHFYDYSNSGGRVRIRTDETIRVYIRDTVIHVRVYRYDDAAGTGGGSRTPEARATHASWSDRPEIARRTILVRVVESRLVSSSSEPLKIIKIHFVGSLAVIARPQGAADYGKARA